MDATPPPAAEPEPLPLPPPIADAPLPLPADPATHPQDDHPHPPVGFTLRRLCHIAVLLFSLFLVVRTTFVEPFGVTTGSMAETIRGNRREKACWRCGYPVSVGSPEAGSGSNPQAWGCCPNCGAKRDPSIPLTPADRDRPPPNRIDLTGEPETFGDRLLVDKLVFRLRPPQRWEVAVFRCPEARPRKDLIDEFSALEAHLPVYEDSKPCENRTYVKRVVGLPGERILVADGDVYANGRIQRKTLSQVRETRIPVFQMDYSPQPGGWAPRWEVGPPTAAGLPMVVPTKLPAVADVVQGASLVLDATATPFGLTYRHRDLDTNQDHAVRDGLGYNGKPNGSFAQRRGDDEEDSRDTVPVHDFMVECEIEVVSGQGGAFAVQLGDGVDTVKVHMPIHADTSGGTAVVVLGDGTEKPFDKSFALVPGKRYRLEFAFTDRRVSVAIDGQEVVTPIDLPEVRSDQRQPRRSIPDKATGTQWEGAKRPAHLDCRGGHVVVHHFALWRDIHYREGSGKHGVKAECPLGSNEYFLLGDNTASSFDSREWATPGVPEHDFLGKPFLVHQPLKATTVPVLGRVQAVDWERFRLLK